MFSEGKSIMAEMEKRQKEVQLLYSRLDVLERNLRLRELTSTQRTEMEQTVQDVKEQLKLTEKELKDLQKENWKTGIIAAGLIFLCFLIYSIHLLFFKEQ